MSVLVPGVARLYLSRLQVSGRFSRHYRPFAVLERIHRSSFNTKASGLRKELGLRRAYFNRESFSESEVVLYLPKFGGIRITSEAANFPECGGGTAPFVSLEIYWSRQRSRLLEKAQKAISHFFIMFPTEESTV
jgi:hypothetical protein